MPASCFDAIASMRNLRLCPPLVLPYVIVVLAQDCTDLELTRRIARRKAETAVDCITLDKRAEATLAASLPALAAPVVTDAGATSLGDLGNASAAAVGPQLPESDDDGAAEPPAWLELSDGRFSPEPLEESALPPDARVVDEQEDRDLLTHLRRQVCIELLLVH